MEQGITDGKEGRKKEKKEKLAPFTCYIHPQPSFSPFPPFPFPPLFFHLSVRPQNKTSKEMLARTLAPFLGRNARAPALVSLLSSVSLGARPSSGLSGHASPSFAAGMSSTSSSTVKRFFSAKTPSDPKKDEFTLLAVSPIDGRYHNSGAPLSPIFSEFGLIKRRVVVEVRWLQCMAQQKALGEISGLSTDASARLDDIVNNFSVADALRVKVG